MKLAVSNIAWEPTELEEHLRLLRELGCDGVELAPNIIWTEPVETTLRERQELRKLIERYGLEVSGFHALLYTRPDLKLFKDRESMQQVVQYLKQLGEVCRDVGGKVLIFGSPKNRALEGRPKEECLEWATEAFREVAEACEGLGVTLCIEPLPASENEFILTSHEGMDLVRRVNHPNFRLHLDAKAMHGAGENMEEAIAKYGKKIRHFHVGDPGLAPPGSTGMLDHQVVGRALKQSGYQGYVSIEMRRGFGPSQDVITKSIDYVKQCYFN